MQPKINVTIKNRDIILFDGSVTAVSTYNDVGLFDVMPLHENFISLIQNKVILHNMNMQKEFKIDQGIIKVKNNKVDIYLDV
jgi:F0F1-type ATP synthase epsilon subunit